MKYKAKPGVIMTQICGKYFLVTSDNTIKLNETAAFCWEHLKQGADEEVLCQRMQDYFEIEDTELLRNDIKSLTESMLANHLLVRYSQ